METEFNTSFIIFPEHTNHLSPLIFGGKFMAELDLCAAKCVRKVLYSSFTAIHAVTHKCDITFLKPCYIGDLININAKLESLGTKSLEIKVKAFRETKDMLEQVAEATFIFISIAKETNTSVKTLELGNKPQFLPYVAHGLKLQS